MDYYDSLELNNRIAQLKNTYINFYLIIDEVTNMFELNDDIKLKMDDIKNNLMPISNNIDLIQEDVNKIISEKYDSEGDTE